MKTKDKQMNRTLFSENMKLADLILSNYRLMYVLPRFDIDLGFGEVTVRQICDRKGISPALFLTICNIYTFEDYLPSDEALEQIPIEELVEYLRKSHEDYRQSRMPMIVEQIHNMLVVNCSHAHGEVISKFCDKYQQEVFTHFKYEEEQVFPYVEQLVAGKRGQFTIAEYEGNHSNIEVVLEDFKNILIKYMPDECTIQKCRNILIGIFLFEDDLNKHSLLEDKVLIPLVERIEKSVTNG